MSTIREFEIPGQEVDIEGNYSLIVLFTEVLNRENFSELIWSRLRSIYLSLGIVNPAQDPKIYFGDCRRHSEFRLAIESEVGSVNDSEWSYGQLVISQNHEWISSLELHKLANLPEDKTQKLIKGIFAKIEDGLVSPFGVVPVGVDGSLRYSYNKILHRLIPARSRFD